MYKLFNKSAFLIFLAFTLFIILFGSIKSLVKNDMIDDICIHTKTKMICIRDN